MRQQWGKFLQGINITSLQLYNSFQVLYYSFERIRDTQIIRYNFTDANLLLIHIIEKCQQSLSYTFCHQVIMPG